MSFVWPWGNFALLMLTFPCSWPARGHCPASTLHTPDVTPPKRHSNHWKDPLSSVCDGWSSVWILVKFRFFSFCIQDSSLSTVRLIGGASSLKRTNGAVFTGLQQARGGWRLLWVLVACWRDWWEQVRGAPSVLMLLEQAWDGFVLLNLDQFVIHHHGAQTLPVLYKALYVGVRKLRMCEWVREWRERVQQPRDHWCVCP